MTDYTRDRSSGFTLVELLIVLAVIAIIAAIALPGLMRARMAANEASAAGSLRAINSGQMTFRFTCGYGGFSPSLQNLGTAVLGRPGFISPDLSGAAPVRKSGYEFVMATASASPTLSCNGGTTAPTYQATATPVGNGGRRFFGTNSGAMLFESPVTLAGTMPETGTPPAPATPLGQ